MSDDIREPDDLRLKQYRDLAKMRRAVQDPEITEEALRALLVLSLNEIERLLSDQAQIDGMIEKAHQRTIDLLELVMKDLPKKPTP